MRYKTRVGVSFWVMFAIVGVMTVGLIILAVYVEPAWSTWLVAVIAAGMAASLFFFFALPIKNTYYEITEVDLLIKTGRHELRIPYGSITDISSGVKSMYMQPTLSFVRVEIKYKTPRGMTDFVHISPVNEKEFVALLKSRV